jgi:hypothetical protein
MQSITKEETNKLSSLLATVLKQMRQYEESQGKIGSSLESLKSFYAEMVTAEE